jgi:protein TonB
MSAEIRHSGRPALILALLAWLSACSDVPESTTTQRVTAEIAEPAATAPFAIEESVTALMRRANTAFRENRIVDPSGDNATELFLAARDRDPNHPGLADALVEIMPLAQFAFEAAVRNDDLAESERLHSLLARIQPDSAITRSAETRVAGLREALARAQAETERTVATAAASTTRVADTAPARRVEPKPVAAPTPATPAAAGIASTPVRETAAAPPRPPRAEASPATLVAAVTAPLPINKIAPDYPPQARSRKLEGFVELEFRVATNGSAEDIRVVRSEPEGLFDRNAVRALMRWKFKPAERNGVPEAATTRTTMNFRQS